MNAALDPSDLLTVDELAIRLKIPKNWIYQQSRSRGRNGRKPLPCLRCGRYLRFSWCEVCAWLRSEPSNPPVVVN